MNTVLAIPDLHFPFEDTQKLKSVYQLIKTLKPKIVIQLGDLYDFYAYSRYPKSSHLTKMTPQEEVMRARYKAEMFWDKIKKVNPKGKFYQLKGNHCDRLTKRVTEKLPELLGVFDFDSLWAFDHVTTINDSRHELKIDDVYYFHGYRTRLGDHCKYVQSSCVVAHTHKPGTFFLRQRFKTIFEMNCGHLANQDSPVLSYTPQKITHSSCAVGYIDKLGPRVIPL